MKNLFNKIAKHKSFLWIVIFFSILHSITYVLDNSYKCVFLFVLIYFGVQKTFTKNIPVSLVISMIINNIVFGSKKIT